MENFILTIFRLFSGSENDDTHQVYESNQPNI